MPSSNEALDSSNPFLSPPLPRPTRKRVAYIQLMQFLSQLYQLSLILFIYLLINSIFYALYFALLHRAITTTARRVPYLPEDVEEDEQDESEGTTATHWTAATESTTSSSFDDYDGIGGASSTGHYYETISSSSSSSAYYTSTSPAPPPSIADFNSQDTPLEFADILPANRRSYDKMEPPKKDGSFVRSFVRF